MTANSTFRNRFVDLDGVRVHCVTEQGQQDGPTFLLVHGLGGSVANWSSLIPLLAQRGRVIALDLGGFGLTEVTPRQASIKANLTLLDHFVTAVCDRPAVVIGNSMGGMLTAQLAARNSRMVAAAVLIDPAIPPSPVSRPHPLITLGFSVYLVPGLDVWATRKREERRTVRQLVEETMKMVTSHFDRVDPAVIDEHIELAEHRAKEYPSGDAAFSAAARSLLLQFARRGQYSQQLHQILSPVLLMHGDRDLLINVKSARALAARHPSWRYVEGKDRGHTPFLDFPEWTAREIFAWLDDNPQIEQRTVASS
ncbi:alpha/beta fold hydrolase [Leekyejoonella antrihumi]|uniref:alpha/beta fold hydrolase n=1 Tax=Leekyejoonella antrihumi TaxID=1660198 RepID=UPI0016448F21|nr:alpha/beta hydrolase [Leekyejoonella antrihumi]